MKSQRYSSPPLAPTRTLPAALERGLKETLERCLDASGTAGALLDHVASSSLVLLGASVDALGAGAQAGSDALARVGAGLAVHLPGAIAEQIPLGRSGPATAPASPMTLESIFGMDLVGIEEGRADIAFDMKPGTFTLPLTLGLGLSANVSRETRLEPHVTVRRVGEKLAIHSASATLSQPLFVWDPVRTALGHDNALTRSPDHLLGAGVRGVEIDGEGRVRVNSTLHALGMPVPLTRFIDVVRGNMPEAITPDPGMTASSLSSALVDQVLRMLGGDRPGEGKIDITARMDLGALLPEGITLTDGHGRLVLPGRVQLARATDGYIMDLQNLEGSLERGRARLGVASEVTIRMDKDWNATHIRTSSLHVEGGGLEVVGKNIDFDNTTFKSSGHVYVKLPPGLDALCASLQLDWGEGFQAEDIRPFALSELATTLLDHLALRLEVPLKSGDHILPRPGQPLWVRVFPDTRATIAVEVAPDAEGRPKITELSIDLSRTVELRDDPKPGEREPGALRGVRAALGTALRHATCAGVRRFTMIPETGQLEATGEYRLGGVPIWGFRTLPHQKGLPLPRVPTDVLALLGGASPAGQGDAAEVEAATHAWATALAKLLGPIETTAKLRTKGYFLEMGPLIARGGPASIEGHASASLRTTRGRVDLVAKPIVTARKLGRGPSVPLRAEGALELSVDGRPTSWQLKNTKLSTRHLRAELSAGQRAGAPPGVESTVHFAGPLSALAADARLSSPAGCANPARIVPEPGATHDA